ncbi:carboxymethylenebutenolidase [Rhodococcus sp. WMMA185]|nr:carboxymethylenebutenolidase [Rhodococcus sp. WMMA185]
MDSVTAPVTSITPNGPARGGVVVIQEAFGVTEHITDVCRRFASAGYHAVAPHLFHRSGDPVVAYDDLETAMPLMGKLEATAIDEDVDAAIEVLAAASIAPLDTAIVGFCMGGTVAFHTAVRRELGAAATYYGGGISQGRFGYRSMLEVAADLQTPWLGLFGDRDKGIPVTDVEELRKAAANAAVATEIVRYPDADHGFNCDDRPAVFNPDAAAGAWSHTLEWFGARLGQS